jgi:hypothetical protein
MNLSLFQNLSALQFFFSSFSQPRHTIRAEKLSSASSLPTGKNGIRADLHG